MEINNGNVGCHPGRPDKFARGRPSGCAKKPPGENRGDQAAFGNRVSMYRHGVQCRWRCRETPPTPEAGGYRCDVRSVAVLRQSEGVSPVMRRNSRLKLLFVLKPEASIASVTLAPASSARQASRIR